MATDDEVISSTVDDLVGRLRTLTAELANLVGSLEARPEAQSGSARTELRRIQDVASDLMFFATRLEPEHIEVQQDLDWRRPTSRPRRFEGSPLFTESILWMNTSRAVNALRMVQSIERALDTFGVRFMMIEEVQGGSFMTRWNALFKSERSRQKAGEIAEMVVDEATAYGRARLADARAEVDLKVSQAVANIAEAAGESDFVWLGSNYVVAKFTGPDGKSVMQGQTLSASQQRLLSENPGSLRSPENVLHDLGFLQEQQRLDNDGASRELPPGER